MQNDMMSGLQDTVREDIKRCVNASDIQDIWTFEKELFAKYQNLIEGFSAGMPMIYEGLSSRSDVMKNIQVERSQLECFLNMGCPTKKIESGVSVNISNTNRIDITMTFEDARSKVENMTSLSQPEIEAILSKISNLESIMNSADSKSKKWDRSKDIIKWIVDKGVDVSIAVLPLIFQMLSQM